MVWKIGFVGMCPSIDDDEPGAPVVANYRDVAEKTEEEK
jgi:hypothetical protein